MAALRELLEAGKVKPVVDRRYALTRSPTRFGTWEKGTPRAKIVLTV